MTKTVFIVVRESPEGLYDYLAKYHAGNGHDYAEWEPLEDVDDVNEEDIAVFETEVLAGVAISRIRRQEQEEEPDIHLEIRKATRRSYIDL